ncbi:MAG: pyridoxamine 5'-phosphate oxidase family protein [Pirellulaceae bacterium]|nr:pyridoxamine 5'-phosphate oxidase family protein [Pirellulaceae bacterium]
MSLRAYFENARGLGVLATSDAAGKVDAALYARPHFLAEGDDEVSLIMADRLSHENLQSNPHAAYLFVEQGEGYVGKRLFLVKVREETDRDKIDALRRRALPPECECDDSENRYLVHFRVEGVRPLVGGE